MLKKKERGKERKEKDKWKKKNVYWLQIARIVVLRYMFLIPSWFLLPPFVLYESLFARLYRRHRIDIMFEPSFLVN